MSGTVLEVAPETERRLSRILVAGAVLCLVATGGLLWWQFGAAVFTDMMMAGLAWCM